MASDQTPRIVITGIGVVSPVGTGVETYWNALKSATNGAGEITLLDTSDYATRIGFEVKDFVPEDWVDGKEARRMDRFLMFAAAAAQMALEDSKFPEDQGLRDETAVVIGSGIGGLGTMSEQTKKLHLQGPSRVSPFLVPYMIPDMASGYVSILHKLRGPNSCIVTACATGANSIGEAAAMIQRGDCVAALAGGAEAPITQMGLAGFCSARAMTTRNGDPMRASRPFDKERDGFVMGEGCGVLVLETLENALARGAKIYGELAGYGQSGDAYHITSPDPEGDGAMRSMRMAIRKAGLTPEDVHYVNAHGTSTELNDKTETKAIKGVFGEHAQKLAVSSTKSMIGHTLGAAGALEAVACLLALRDQIAPPTINYEVPDPECDLDYVPNVARPMPMEVALSNSFGFGGHNATLVFKRYQE